MTCYTIKKLTNTYVIFKGCHDKTELKYYFDEDDLEDILLYHLISKDKDEHYSISTELGVYIKPKNKPKLTKEEKKEMIANIIASFGSAYLSDISEYIDININETAALLKELKKEGKIDIK